ncbi:hypothetical protein BKA65DRAFT_37227 [Rhexocercosporidium sp. MPI-PUGE-AT-0058]|nr:hypothetical protein BKA65DRAFT_37227 [Rhexocercosporidium sp. MPI-PUGE-AT-0058]
MFHHGSHFLSLRCRHRCDLCRICIQNPLRNSTVVRYGHLALHDQAAAASKDLADFSARLATSIRVHGKGKPLVESEIVLESLRRECVELAGELASKLDGLRVKERGKLWKSVGAFLKSVWSKKELEEIEKRLAEYRNALNTRLMGSLRYFSAILPTAVRAADIPWTTEESG